VEEVRRGRPLEDEGAITLDLPLTALLPASYIADVELRLATYRRVAAVTDRRGLSEAREELIDRFGPIPPEVEHLFALIELRLRCAELGIESLVEREREIVIRPVVTERLDKRRLTARLGRAIRLTQNTVRLRLPELETEWQAAVDLVLDAVEATVAEPLAVSR
jgi:transcription-repair coupling factor (superfamily II helicase)